MDFISDVTCPWCAIGFTALDRAIERLGAEVAVELHLQPFELNPGMPPEGEDILGYMARKYGTAEAVAERQAEIRSRGAEAGFTPLDRARGPGTPSTRTDCCNGPGWKAGNAN